MNFINFTDPMNSKNQNIKIFDSCTELDSSKDKDDGFIKSLIDFRNEIALTLGVKINNKKDFEKNKKTIENTKKKILSQSNYENHFYFQKICKKVFDDDLKNFNTIKDKVILEDMYFKENWLKSRANNVLQNIRVIIFLFLKPDLIKQIQKMRGDHLDKFFEENHFKNPKTVINYWLNLYEATESKKTLDKFEKSIIDLLCQIIKFDGTEFSIPDYKFDKKQIQKAKIKIEYNNDFENIEYFFDKLNLEKHLIVLTFIKLKKNLIEKFMKNNEFANKLNLVKNQMQIEKLRNKIKFFFIKHDFKMSDF